MKKHLRKQPPAPPAPPPSGFPFKLIDLEPEFFRYVREENVPQRRHKDNGYLDDPAHKHTPECFEDYVGPRIIHRRVETIEEAQGVQFLCPLCFIAKGGRVGCHRVMCWSRSRGVPDDANPGPGRWKLVGTGFEDLSLMEEEGQSRSVLLIGGCAWHGFVTHGIVT